MFSTYATQQKLCAPEHNVPAEERTCPSSGNDKLERRLDELLPGPWSARTDD